MNQLAQRQILLSHISPTLGSFLCTSSKPNSAITLVNVIAFATCQSRVAAFCLKRKLVPLEIQALFGGVSPSWGHGRRILKIVKSEYWRQVRLLQDFLWAILADRAGCNGNDRRYKDYMKLAGQVTDFLWHRARLKLQSGQKEVRTTQNTVTVLGDVTLPSKVREILEKGPKFSFDPGAQRPQLLAIARRAAICPGITDKDRATSDAVSSVMCKVGEGPVKKPPLISVAKALRVRELTVLQADKEGGFLVMPQGMFQEKALAAISKNFKPCNFNARSTKRKAVKLLKDLNLESLRKKVEKTDPRQHNIGPTFAQRWKTLDTILELHWISGPMLHFRLD